MKKMILIILIVIGLGFLLNIGSGYSLEKVKTTVCDGAQACDLSGAKSSLEGEERGFPVAFSIEDAADTASNTLSPFGSRIEAGSFMTNQLFWMGVSGVLFGVFHWLKKLVSRTVLIGLAIAAALVYFGILKLA